MPLTSQNGASSLHRKCKYNIFWNWWDAFYCFKYWKEYFLTVFFLPGGITHSDSHASSCQTRCFHQLVMKMGLARACYRHGTFDTELTHVKTLSHSETVHVYIPTSRNTVLKLSLYMGLKWIWMSRQSIVIFMWDYWTMIKM